MKKLIAAFICVLGFSQCNNKVYSLDNLPKQFIEIGSYGGFAGLVESYHFFPNGQRFLENSISGNNEVEKTEPKDFKNLLKGLKEINFKDLELNEPGNMSYFVRLKTKKQDKKLTWSNMDTAPEALVKFYKNSIKDIKKEAIK